MTDLEKWFKAINKISESERISNATFDANLPDPDATYISEEFEYGFWKIDEGLIQIRKLKSGYNMRAQVIITNEQLEAMFKAWGKFNLLSQDKEIIK